MPKLNTEHIIVSNRPGTVAVLFCRNCQEELPITKALKDPQVVQKFAEQGAIAHPETPAEFAAFIGAEAKKWQAVVKASGASVD